MSRELWVRGHGPIVHTAETQAAVAAIAQRLVESGRIGSAGEVYAILAAADRLACAAMWTVAHMSYARRVDTSGAALLAEDFKTQPEGHLGGSLNVAIAYVGYFAANRLCGRTRAWLLGQGHCVAAIEAANVLLDNLSPQQIGRYDRSEAGLSRLAQDFYGYGVDPTGRPSAPIGSHVGPHTAGGLCEGGYLGLAELQYPHIPLPGETLVAFLSDGAFEEQRGTDWAPRWWRAEDSGAVVPIMILNGRRIEQRTEIAQDGGAAWLTAHQRNNGFSPVVIDGHDPAAHACAIIEAEARLETFAADAGRRYPAPMPYVIARCTKGFGFPGAGGLHVHNLPLPGNPRFDAEAREAFNAGAAALFTPPDELEDAVRLFLADRGRRPAERDNPSAGRNVGSPRLPPVSWTPLDAEPCSAMDAIDEAFLALVETNPELRVRVGNPDELRSNHMGRTLERLRHRVNVPEPGAPEAVDGAVITALNEEAVIGACLGNKAGLNLAVSYEAFAVKMLGALRQEVIFEHRRREIGLRPGWISVPLIATSHTWENAKNEQSHQDPTLAEALLGEMSSAARVLFPIDANTAVAALYDVYSTKGVIAELVVPKRALRNLLDGVRARAAVVAGAAHISGDPAGAQLQLVAIGAYQALEAMQAAERLVARGVHACVTAIIEPGRFRKPRDLIEADHVVKSEDVVQLFPRGLPRVLLCHTRPEPMLGLLRPLDGGPGSTRALGYINRGGTLDPFGMLFANRCTWAHAVSEAADLLHLDRAAMLSSAEIAAVDGCGEPRTLDRSALANPIPG